MSFLDDNFLLQTKTAQTLYHEHAKHMPIIDYHCHLNPEDIANDRKFNNLTQIWLEGDHYKWRAMRTNGIPEQFCTGDADDYAKFEKWAQTVPFTMRNPLYHWTHMELKRPFGIEKVLNPESARDIYDEATALLQTPEYSVRGILKQMNVVVICTTDDPVDSLEHHQKIAADDFGIKVLPTFRPDKTMAIEDAGYLTYLQKLEAASGVSIGSYQQLLEALQKRHDFFHAQGGRLSDHGLETMYAEEFTGQEISQIFEKALQKQALTQDEVLKFKSAMLLELALMDHAKGWTQQFHLGALRNNNTRMMRELGADTGFDSIGDFDVARPLSRFMDKLDNSNQLAKTILYNLNPSQNELYATMIGNFNDGSTPGKVQYGSAWWFLDQKQGMEAQMNALSNMGLLSRFVGMLTDSRSFLSYPRHEYFRRILCNMLGNDVENGELPASEMPWIGQMVENICYNNAKNYFNF
ncbi:glucuronate isomerase [Rufibacter glacialis]|uniref:Uronate isomerase n=1 Tax=Rufibacter glacialis TaxID=1259555 RepID=A0A5M8Q492_9BACT|nr:glucuronate isomerase [Rufibacter glacialis]KAA6430669.1 glucuronate isomerase [Rufibacter glacialis]GGK85635.1 uronate isomerase [Rufibacter glacialis]